MFVNTTDDLARICRDTMGIHQERLALLCVILFGRVFRAKWLSSCRQVILQKRNKHSQCSRIRILRFFIFKKHDFLRFLK